MCEDDKITAAEKICWAVVFVILMVVVGTEILPEGRQQIERKEKAHKAALYVNGFEGKLGASK